jgi:hypothetical protein
MGKRESSAESKIAIVFAIKTCENRASNHQYGARSVPHEEVFMKTRCKFPALYASIAVLALVSGCATTSTETTQKWSYNHGVIGGASDGGGGSVSKNTLVLTLPSPKSTAGKMKIVGAIIEPCMAGGVDVKVEYTSESMVLLPSKNYANCPDYRITIRNDGTGGKIERKHYKVTTWSLYTDDPGLLPR